MIDTTVMLYYGRLVKSTRERNDVRDPIVIEFNDNAPIIHISHPPIA